MGLINGGYSNLKSSEPDQDLETTQTTSKHTFLCDSVLFR